MEEAIRLYNNGLTFKEISRILGKPYTTIQKYFQQNGYKKNLTPLQRQVKVLWEQGKTNREIADELGHNINVVQKCLKALRLEYNGAEYKTPFNSEERVAEIISNHQPHLEYIGEYTGTDGTAKVRCKECGYVFTVSMISVRADNHKWCPECKKEKEKLTRLKRVKIPKLPKYNQGTQIVFNFGECKECGKMFQIEKSKVFCSKQCKTKYANNHKDRRLKKCEQIDNSITLIKLFERDNGVCHICGKVCDYNADPNSNDYPSIDHIQAIAQGGNHTWDNVRLAHRGCNLHRWIDVQRIA